MGLVTSTYPNSCSKLVTLDSKNYKCNNVYGFRDLGHKQQPDLVSHIGH